MAKSEYEGIAFTSAIKDGWQVSVTERAGSSAEAVANLEGTIEVMKSEGYLPFVRDYNKAELDKPEPSLASEPEVIGVPLPTDPFPTTVVQEAVQELGAVEVPQLSGTLLEDGTHYLGIKTTKLKVAECLQGNSYEIVVDKYKKEADKIEFFNEHSQYPACTHSLKGKGEEMFQEMFPTWNPLVGEGKIAPIKLYIVGEGKTNQGNAWQNLKGVKPA